MANPLPYPSDFDMNPDMDFFAPQSRVPDVERLVVEFNVQMQGVVKQLENQISQLQQENQRLRAGGGKYGIAQAQAAASPQQPQTRLARPSLASIESGPDGEGDKNKLQRKKTLTAKEARAAMQALDVHPGLTHKDDVAEHGSIGKAKKKTRHLFTDVDEMKQQVRHAILKPYSVTEYYKENGFCVRVASNHLFEHTTLFVVFLNSIWVAVDVDINGAMDNKDKHWFYQAIEWLFFAYFLGEVIIRFLAFKHKYNCIKDFWFSFDAALVIMMVIDTLLPFVFSGGLPFNTAVLRLVRLVKISRMARIARLLNRWPELAVLVKGIGIAMRSVCSTMMLLLILVYIFSVAFRYLTIDTDVGDEYFRTVFYGMKVLLLLSTMPDTMDFVDEMGGVNIIVAVILVVFVLLASLTLMNMLIGVLCEVIGVVSTVEKEEARTSLVKDHLLQVFSESENLADATENTIISKHEFQDLLLNQSVSKVMRGVGVDPVGLIDFIDYIFSGDFESKADHGLTFAKLVELICGLGGSNSATVKDVIDMRQVVVHQLANIEDMLEKRIESIINMAVPPQVPATTKAAAPQPSTPSLGEADINAFLQNAASIWVAQAGITGKVSSPLEHLPADGSHMGSSEIKYVTPSKSDLSGPVIDELAAFVKDLQTRLEQTQAELKDTKQQLTTFEGQQYAMGSELQATKAQVGACEGRTQNIERVYQSFEGRTQAIESGLSSLKGSAQQQPPDQQMQRPPIQDLAQRGLLPPGAGPGGGPSGGVRNDFEASLQRLREQSMDLQKDFHPGQKNSARERIQSNIHVNLPRGSSVTPRMAVVGTTQMAEPRYNSQTSGSWTPENYEVSSPNPDGHFRPATVQEYTIQGNPNPGEQPRGNKGGVCGCT
jgi:hypothetical protein